MAGLLLDTDACIAIIRGRAPAAVSRLRRRAPGTVGLSSITLAELRFGVEKSRDPGRNAVALAQFSAPLRVLPFDDAAAEAYGVLRLRLESAGTPIGPLDTLIAAHALSLGLGVVTGNRREFARVPGLRIEPWDLA